MSKLTTTQRILLASALCIAVLVLHGIFFPPQAPPEGEAGASAETEGLAGEDTEGGTETEGTGGESAPTPTPAPEDPPAAPDPAPETGSVDAVEHIIDNGVLELVLSNRSDGVIADARGIKDQFVDAEGAGFSFLGIGEDSTLELGFDPEQGDVKWGRSNAEVVEKNDKGWTLRRVEDGMSVRSTLELLENYEALYTVEVENLGTQARVHRLRLGTRQGLPEEESRYNVHRALCRTPGDLEDFDQGDLEDEEGRVKGADWIGLDSQYFAQLIVPTEAPFAGCVTNLDAEAQQLVAEGYAPKVDLQPGESHTYRFGLYLGAKEKSQLEAYSVVEGAMLEEAIDWGFLGIISETIGGFLLSLLRWFYGLTGIWGVAIVMLTIVVKLITLPLTLKQYASMRRMREIQPEMNEIREKYKEDKTKQQQEMQALWQRTGVNPLAGCLPMVVQMPVWFALYSMLGTVVELYKEPFLWLPDLTAPDPYNALPLAMGALMFLQMGIQPQAGDNQQAKIMKIAMPIFFTVMMWVLPSGLGVYIFANIVLSLIQSLIQLRPWDKSGGAKAGAASKGAK